MINAQYEHDLPGEVRFPYDKMPPESDIDLRVIGWKSRISGENIHLAKYGIDFIVGQDTEITIDDSVKLSLCVESETEFISDVFLLGDILPPREFHFIPVAVDLGRWNDGMECRRFSEESIKSSGLRYSLTRSVERGLLRFFFSHISTFGLIPIFFDIVKRFLHLLGFDLKLFLVRNRKPLASSINLKMRREFLLKRRFLHGFEDLRLEVAGAGFENSEIHDASGNGASGDDDLPSIRR